jgi:hypothetical protein
MMATSTDAEGVGAVVRSNQDAVEDALVEFDREALRALGVEPDAVVDAVLTPAFMDANTDFPGLETFLDVAGAETVWALGDWLDWVLDWHVLGNTRFWSWEWMVHAGVAVRATAAAVGPVRCVCGGRVVPVTASAVEEPGRADAWVEFRCADCDRTGRATRSPDGDHELEGLVGE